MAQHSAHHPYQPTLTFRLRRAHRRWTKAHPRITTAARRVRAHGPFTAYAVMTVVLMAWMLLKICCIPN